VLPHDQWTNVFPNATAPHFGLSGEKFFALYGPDVAILEKIVAHASKHSVSGSPALLESIEQANMPPITETCMLLCTISGMSGGRLASILRSWLDTQTFTSH
jgi:hypothetical protein